MAVSTSTVLDVPTLVSQLMSIERQPITKLEAKVTDYEAKISSLGTIKGLVSTLQSALTKVSTSLSSFAATSSDSNIFSATASSSAVAGNYAISVTSLASAQTLVAKGVSSSTTALTGAESTLDITVGSTPSQITIPANATLSDIRSAINAANIGVSATIINDGSGAEPYRLSLTSTKTGSANAISAITVTGDSTLSGLLSYVDNGTDNGNPDLTEIAATNAEFSINGINITSATNTVSDAIEGVTLTLKSKTTTPATLTIDRDTSSMETALSSFVEGYNALVSQLKSRSAYSTSSTSTQQPLAGDGTVRLMLEQLRGILSTPATGGTLSYLSEVGISVQADSSLKFDSSKFKSAVGTNYADVQNLFNSSSGFITRLSSWGDSTMQTGGVIDTRLKTFNDNIQNYNDQIGKLELRMKQLQQQYTTTYTNLNVYLGTMNSISTFLTNQLNAGKTSS